MLFRSRTGNARTKLLVYFRDGDRYVLIASNFGRPGNPLWFNNIRHEPRVTFETATEKFEAQAEIADPVTRDRVFAAVSEQQPGFLEYQRGLARTIPVVLLARTG